MEFGVLGPVVVAQGGVPIHVGGPKPRTVLALLLASEGRVGYDELVEALWGPAAPAGARKTLQTHVYHLRLALGDGIVVHDAGGYRLVAAREQVDARCFEDEAIAARELLATRPGEAVDLLRGAEARWRGPAYADVPEVPQLHTEARRLAELRAGALEDRIEGELALGGHIALLSELEASTLEHPLRERLQALQILALYRSGRQADALRAYDRTRRALAEQLGVDPGAPLRRLHQLVLSQDPALDLAPVGALGRGRNVDPPGSSGSRPRPAARPLLSARFGRGAWLKAAALVAVMAASAFLATQVGDRPVPGSSRVVEDATHARSDRAPRSPIRVATPYLLPGECFNALPDTDPEQVWAEVVACDTPHDHEVVAVVPLSAPRDVPYPGVDGVYEDAELACQQTLERYVGAPLHDSPFRLLVHLPTEGSWDSGDREAICSLHERDRKRLTGSIAGRGG